MRNSLAVILSIAILASCEQPAEPTAPGQDLDFVVATNKAPSVIGQGRHFDLVEIGDQERPDSVPFSWPLTTILYEPWAYGAFEYNFDLASTFALGYGGIDFRANQAEMRLSGSMTYPGSSGQGETKSTVVADSWIIPGDHSLSDSLSFYVQSECGARLNLTNFGHVENKWVAGQYVVEYGGKKRSFDGSATQSACTGAGGGGGGGGGPSGNGITWAESCDYIGTFEWDGHHWILTDAELQGCYWTQI